MVRRVPGGVAEQGGHVRPVRLIRREPPDGERVELQFRPGDREQFDALRARAHREGPVGFEDLPRIGDATFRHAAGIPGVTAFVGSHVIVIQTLDRVPPQVATKLAALAADACCPG